MWVDEICYWVWVGVDGLVCVGCKFGSIIMIGYGNDGGIDGYWSM